MLRGSAPAEDEIWDRNAYDDRNTRRALRRSGLRRPEIDGDLLEVYARYFARRGWVEVGSEISSGRRSPA